VFLGRETSTHYFSCSGGSDADSTKKHIETRYAGLVFLYPVGSVGRVVYFWGMKHRRIIYHAQVGRCKYQKKRDETRYAEVVFLHLVGSAGSVLWSRAPGA
jgi:hypothetical protein